MPILLNETVPNHPDMNKITIGSSCYGRMLQTIKFNNFNLLYVILIAVFLMLCSCATKDKYDAMQKALSDFVKDKDANIGIAVIIDGNDTVAVNGNKDFPMLSVYKFPIAMAFAEKCRQNNLSSDFPMAILPEDLHADTYSPMTEKIVASGKVFTDTLRMPAIELLGYMLQQSDNNASDIVLHYVNGPENVERYLRGIGINDVNVRSSEAEMHADNSLCYTNSATPIGMASLMDKFCSESDDSISIDIKRLMQTCGTGKNRLPKPIKNAVIGHKTGTGFVLPGGRLMAVNDAGYVCLPDGHRYSIAVFIENSGLDMPQTEDLIAQISNIVLTLL